MIEPQSNKEASQVTAMEAGESRFTMIQLNEEEDDQRQEAADLGASSSIWLHAMCIRRWQLAKLEPTQKEAKTLEKSAVSNETLRACLVWRRPTLLASTPAVPVSAILAWVDLSMTCADNKAVLNGLGDFVCFIPSTASTGLFISSAAALFRWSNWRQTTRIFRAGWAISFLLPFLPSIFPIGVLLNSCDTPAGEACGEDRREELRARASILEFALAVQCAFQLFPVLIAFPGGLARVLLKMQGLFPESTLSSWILVVSAPFQSIIFLMALALLIQLSGNVALFVGTIFLFCAPWIHVIRCKVCVGVPTEERENQLDRTQMVVGILAQSWAASSLLFGLSLEMC